MEVPFLFEGAGDLKALFDFEIGVYCCCLEIWKVVSLMVSSLRVKSPVVAISD